MGLGLVTSSSHRGLGLVRVRARVSNVLSSNCVEDVLIRVRVRVVRVRVRVVRC